MSHPYVQFEGTRSWKILDAAVDALVKNGDIIEQTSRAYIVGSLCKALQDKETRN